MFELFKQLGKAAGLNIQPEPANAPKPQSSGAASQITPQTTPDKPVPFGYKSSWLCVKAGSPEEVIEKVGLKAPRVSSWKDGVYGKHGGVFVSPVLDGYVLVVGWEGDILETNPARLDELAGKFPELQFFSTHRVSDYHAWAKYINGEIVRGYCWCGCDGTVLLNRGEPTPEEVRLGLTNLLPDDEADWDNYETPDEENVLDIAAAWGIDTRFNNKTYPESTGFICDV